MRMKEGKLIVIEGTDGSGKATQTRRLIDRLNSEGIKCQSISFPRYGTPTGKIVGGAYLGKPEICKSFFDNPAKVDPIVASLYYAADRFAAKAEMEKIIESGINIICDRYVESNMAHQGGKISDEVERSSYFDFISRLEYDLLGMPIPNETIFLYTPYPIGMKNAEKRGSKDGHESSEEHLKRAEETYLELAKDGRWRRIECTENGKMKSVESISEEVYKIAKEVLG